MEDTNGEGYLLIDMMYKSRYLNQGCELTVGETSLKNHTTGKFLINKIPTNADGSKLTKKIGEYKHGQFNMYGTVFDFDRESMPYDLEVRITLKCDGEQTEYLFSRPLKFKMAQPVIWEQ